jgi:dolichol-phosphate mannosyltransferase
MIRHYDLFIILPAFNKAVEIEECVIRLRKVLSPLGFSYMLIIVDDGSRDNTVDIIKSSHTFNNTILVTHRKNLGKGAAVRTGFNSVFGNPKYVAYLDADLDLNPITLPTLFLNLENDLCEVAIGSKLHKDSIVLYPVFRKILSAIFAQITRVTLGVSVKDSQTGMKVFRWDLLSDYLRSFKSNGYLFDLELLNIVQKRGFRIMEGPIELNYQFNSSLTIRRSARIFLDLLALVLRNILSLRFYR